MCKILVQSTIDGILKINSIEIEDDGEQEAAKLNNKKMHRKNIWEVYRICVLCVWIFYGLIVPTHELLLCISRVRYVQAAVRDIQTNETNFGLANEEITYLSFRRYV